MATFKYSNSHYVRKSLGLAQARKLIETFPWLELSEIEREEFTKLIESKNAEKIINWMKERRKEDGTEILFDL